VASTIAKMVNHLNAIARGILWLKKCKFVRKKNNQNKKRNFVLRSKPATSLENQRKPETNTFNQEKYSIY